VRRQRRGQSRRPGLRLVKRLEQLGFEVPPNPKGPSPQPRRGLARRGPTRRGLARRGPTRRGPTRRGPTRRGPTQGTQGTSLGTLDGANVEIRDAVGHDQFFLFGLTAGEALAKRPGYRPSDELADAELARVIDLIRTGEFSPGNRGLFAPLIDDLLHRDPFFVLADFRAYVDCQREVEALWRTPAAWLRSSILNTARAGRFSSDRAIAEYARDIWNVAPVTSRAR
jgi:hypothetical protein